MNHFKGLIYGGALGDALGAPHEMKYNKKLYKYTGKLQYDWRYQSRFMKEPIYYPKGQVTDDTEMMMCICQMLDNNNFEFNREKLILKYENWASNGIRFLGRNTRALLKGIKTVHGYENRMKKINENDKENMQSNGCLMRAGIFGLMLKNSTDKEKTKEFIEIDTRITNPNDHCVEIVYHFAHIICMALEGCSKDEMTTYLSNIENDYIIAAIHKQNMDLSNKGWIYVAIYCAVYGFLHFNTFKEGIDYIINEFDGDTDTNACIGGYLMGAYYGFDEMIKDETTRYNVDIIKNCESASSNEFIFGKYFTDDKIKELYENI